MLQWEFLLFSCSCVKKTNRYCIVECVNKVYLYPYLSMRLVFLISVKMGLSQFSSDNIHNVRRLSISRPDKINHFHLFCSSLIYRHCTSQSTCYYSSWTTAVLATIDYKTSELRRLCRRRTVSGGYWGFSAGRWCGNVQFEAVRFTAWCDAKDVWIIRSIAELS